MTWTKWSERQPENLVKGRVLLWKTKKVNSDLIFIMSGPLSYRHNGVTSTDHIMPPMTRWDGWQHLIPSDLEWSEDVPEWIEREATWERKDKWGCVHKGVTDHKLVQLVEVVGIDLLPCPFSGKQPRWESRDGWIGAMPHQQHEFTVRGAVSRGFVSCPKRAAELWNTRATQ